MNAAAVSANEWIFYVVDLEGGLVTERPWFWPD